MQNHSVLVLIVGAGISGSTCARILAERNYKITIIDKNDFIAGSCYDYVSEDKTCYIHKFGPHIFHTDNSYVWNFINRFDTFNNYIHCVYTSVDSKIYTFPINLNVISDLYNTRVYSKDDVENLIHDIHYDNPKNFEELAINSVGTKIYNSFIKKYTEKQWNTNPKNLPIEIFNRINIRYNYDNGYFPNQYQGQPKHGYTNLIKNMLNHQNINVILNQDFQSFDTTNYDYIIYTGTFEGLEYRSIYFDHYTSNINNNFAVLNTPNDDLYTRVTNFNILHKIKKSDIYHYCKEIPAKNNQYNELYPIRNKQNLNIYKDKVNQMQSKYKNIFFCGRMGTYQYLDMDKAIQSAFDIIRNFQI